MDEKKSRQFDYWFVNTFRLNKKRNQINKIWRFYFLLTTILNDFRIDFYKIQISLIIILTKLPLIIRLYLFNKYYYLVIYFYFFDLYDIDFITKPTFYQMYDPYIQIYHNYAVRLPILFIITNKIILTHYYLSLLFTIKRFIQNKEFLKNKYSSNLFNVILLLLKLKHTLVIKKQLNRKASYISQDLYPWDTKTTFQKVLKKKKEKKRRVE